MEDQSRMPAGFRFYPTEEELVGFYLRQQLLGKRKNQLQYVIPVLDIYDYNPWDLPQLSGDQCRQDPQLQEWFFFIPRQEKEARGGRPNRLTASGYWKATGSPGYVYSSDSRIIGEKRTMLFYKGRAPGSKTDWKMNEYRVIDHDHANPVLRLDFSLCRVYIRSKCIIRSYDRRPSSSSSSAGSVRRNPAIKTSSPLNHQQNHPLSTMNGDRSGSSRKNSASSDDRNAFNNEVHHQLDERTSQRALLEGNNDLGIFNMDDDEPLWKWEPYLNSDEWTII